MSIGIRQWPEERRINQAEDCGRRPNAETEHTDRCRGEPRGFTNQAERLSNVVWQGHAA
jgi:hypothetical protein